MISENSVDTSNSSQAIALIIGASKNIGRALSLEFAKRNIHVIIAARSEKHLVSLYDEIIEQNSTATISMIDICNTEQIYMLAEYIYQRFKRLDYLVLNAARNIDLTPVSSIDDKSFDKIINVNLKAQINILAAFHNLCTFSGTKITFLSDEIAQKSEPFWGLYSASKIAAEMIIKTYYAENKNISNISTQIIHLPPTATSMRKVAFPSEDVSLINTPEQTAQMIAQQIFK